MSWKQELDRKYEEITSMGDTKLIDRANEIILEAIAKLQEEMPNQETKRISKWWHTLTNEEKKEIYYFDRGK